MIDHHTIPPLQQRINMLLEELINAHWEDDEIKVEMIKQELTAALAKQEAGEMFDPPF